MREALSPNSVAILHADPISKHSSFLLNNSLEFTFYYNSKMIQTEERPLYNTFN